VPVFSSFIWTVTLAFVKNSFATAAAAGIGSALLSMNVTTGRPGVPLPSMDDPHAVSASAPTMAIASGVVPIRRRTGADVFDRDTTFTTAPPEISLGIRTYSLNDGDV
jgi:hypothetical protein